MEIFSIFEGVYYLIICLAFWPNLVCLFLKQNKLCIMQSILGYNLLKEADRVVATVPQV